MDAGLNRSLFLRAWRRRAVMLILCALFVEFCGLPGVRIDQGPNGAQARYLCVDGMRRLSTSVTGRETPLIVLVPLERSVLSYARGAGESLWQEVIRAAG